MTGAADGGMTESAVVSSAEAEEILQLAAAAEHTDRVYPLDDQVRLDVGAGVAGLARHLLVRRSDHSLVGYAHLDLRTEKVATAHVVVAPSGRRRGVGRALIERAGSGHGTETLNVWAHGDVAAAAACAEALDLIRVRELRQLSLGLDAEPPPPSYPKDVTVRTFEPGRDEAAWVALNARAFSAHPEQGRWDLEDLRQRLSQPWFDPEGFFLAERDSVLLGFHWTKVHEATADDEAAGEVYVLGVDPEAQGLGLGKALTVTGLRHLRSLGLHRVMLYVEGDNAAALATYRGLGFTTTRADVVYERAQTVRP